MTGSGTENDPYICDTWEELISVSTAKSVHIRMSGNQIFDFNEIQPLGFDSQVNLSGQINFNGCIFRNFYSKSLRAVYILNGTSWQNLSFENFYQQTASSSSSENAGFLYTDAGSSAIKITNCKFYGKVNYGIYSTKKAVVFYSANYRTLQFEQCSFSLECSCTSGIFSLFNAGFLKNCNVRFVINSRNAVIFSSNESTVNYALNSLFDGKINVSDMTGSILSGGNLSGYNVYRVQANAPMQYTGAGVSVFNRDLSPDTQGYGTFVGCTSEQLKNAEYLYSVGFPCYR